MNTLYLECNAGISGDMLVAALLDLGADRNALDKALQSIPAKGFTYAISRVSKAGVDCCDFDVILDAEHENHDHDMEFLHGESHIHEHHHDHEHAHEHDHHHEHEHEEEHTHMHAAPVMQDNIHEEILNQEHGHQHTHAHLDGEQEHTHEHEHHHDHTHEHVPHEHHHTHEHRGLKEVIEIINGTDMTDHAREIALKIFDIIAVAEGKAHNVAKEEVHFHEVGAIDSIVDVVAIAVCADSLDLGEVIVPVLCEGRGTVRCQHGVLPVPVPAVANIMQSFALPVRLLPVQGEFVTPTGAAAAAALRTSGELPAQFTIKAIGLGAGKRQYERPSILRALIIE